MPRRGSLLTKFLKDALVDSKYYNLFWKNKEDDIFCLNCVHKSNFAWTEDDVKIFEDWYTIKSSNAIHKNSFADKRQRLLAAMKKSKFLKAIPELSNRNLRVFQFVYADEVEGSDGDVSNSGSTILANQKPISEIPAQPADNSLPNVVFIITPKVDVVGSIDFYPKSVDSSPPSYFF